MFQLTCNALISRLKDRYPRGCHDYRKLPSLKRRLLWHTTRAVLPLAFFLALYTLMSMKKAPEPPAVQEQSCGLLKFPSPKLFQRQPSRASKPADLEPEEMDLGLKAPPAALSGRMFRRGVDREGDEVDLWGTLLEDAKQAHDDADQQLSAPADARELLARHVAFPGAAKCGSWVHKYRQLHEAIRRADGSVPVKFLTYENVMEKPGLGDRLNGLVSAFLAALLTNRALIMADTSLLEIFEPVEIDWFVRDDVPTQVTTETMYNVTVGSVLRIYQMRGKRGVWRHSPKCDRMVWDILPQFKGTEGASNIVLHTHMGILTRIFSHPESDTYETLWDLGLRLPTAFGCILRYLLRPRSAVLERVAHTLEAGTSRKGAEVQRLCVHQRTMDNIAWGTDYSGRPDSKGSLASLAQAAACRLINCTQAVEDYWVPPSVSAKWMVMSDSALIKRAIEVSYPHKVLTSGEIPVHWAFGGLVSTAVDWLLCSTAQYFIITDSGFSKTAYAYNLDTRPLYIMPRLDYPLATNHGNCTPPQPLSIMEFRTWSSL